MKREIKKRVLSLALAALTMAGTILGSSTNVQAATATYYNAAQICDYVYKGYNGGAKGPITITKGTYYNGWTKANVYLVTMSGTEDVKNQSTGYLTDLLSGFNLNNPYVNNVVYQIQQNIPANSNIILAGHSLGGMVAQQVAANDTIKNKYNIMKTVTFGSPLLSAGQREGDVKRLGDTSDVIPYASGSTINNTAWAIAGLNRENGGYGKNLLAAHTESYLREDVWGAYDITGTKYGSACLVLDTNSIKYFKSPTNGKY